jgi:hypothetical protein
MRIMQERQFEIELTPTEIGARVKGWANSGGFVCTTDTPQLWSFERGSRLVALYTFDIKKIPTKVNVVLMPGQPQFLRCTFSVSAPFSLSTSGDKKWVSAQLDALVDHIKSAS